MVTDDLTVIGDGLKMVVVEVSRRGEERKGKKRRNEAIRERI